MAQHQMQFGGWAWLPLHDPKHKVSPSAIGPVPLVGAPASFGAGQGENQYKYPDGTSTTTSTSIMSANPPPPPPSTQGTNNGMDIGNGNTNSERVMGQLNQQPHPHPLGGGQNLTFNFGGTTVPATGNIPNNDAGVATIQQPLQQQLGGQGLPMMGTTTTTGPPAVPVGAQQPSLQPQHHPHPFPVLNFNPAAFGALNLGPHAGTVLPPGAAIAGPPLDPMAMAAQMAAAMAAAGVSAGAAAGGGGPPHHHAPFPAAPQPPPPPFPPQAAPVDQLQQEAQQQAQQVQQQAQQGPDLQSYVEDNMWRQAVRRARSHPWEARLPLPDGSGTALHQACMNDAPVNVVSALLEAYPDAALVQDSDGWTPLHMACYFDASPGIVRRLLEPITDANDPSKTYAHAVKTLKLRDEEDRTPLQLVHSVSASRWKESQLSRILHRPLPRSWEELRKRSSEYADELRSDNDLTRIWKKVRLLLWASYYGDLPPPDAEEKAAAAANSSSRSGRSSRRAATTEVEQHLRRGDVSSTAMAVDDTPGNNDCHRVQQGRNQRCRREEYRLVHACAGIEGCPADFVKLAVHLYPDQLREVDGRGNLPLHLAAMTPKSTTGRPPPSSTSSIAMDVVVDGGVGGGVVAPPPGVNVAVSVGAMSTDSDMLDGNLSSGESPPFSSSSSSTFHIINFLIQAYPAAASCRNHDYRLPLLLAVREGRKTWEEGVHAIVEAHPAATTEGNEETGLYPFMLAAAAPEESCCLGTSFQLLRCCPELDRFAHWPRRPSSSVSSRSRRFLSRAVSAPAEMSADHLDDRAVVVSSAGGVATDSISEEYLADEEKDVSVAAMAAPMSTTTTSVSDGGRPRAASASHMSLGLNEERINHRTSMKRRRSSGAFLNLGDP